MKKLTILIPAYNEAENLPELRRRLELVFDGMRSRVEPEYILLDNRSSDRTPEIARSFCAQNPQWKYIRYSRNFGYHNSLACGFDLATGDALIVVAGDIQEPPEKIPEMVDLWEKDHQVVYGILQKRNDNDPVKSIGAWLFYRLLFSISGDNAPKNATDFRLIDRKVIDVVRRMREPDRYLRALVQWTGFNQAPFQYDRAPRTRGKSVATFWYGVKWGINAIISFSTVPLRLATYFGLIVLIGSFVFGLYFLLAHFIPALSGTRPPTGTTAILVLLSFAIGLNAFFLGIIGEYVGRSYAQGKERPLYIIDEAINIKVE